jgi:hypothetical protein
VTRLRRQQACEYHEPVSPAPSVHTARVQHSWPHPVGMGGMLRKMSRDALRAVRAMASDGSFDGLDDAA